VTAAAPEDVSGPVGPTADAVADSDAIVVRFGDGRFALDLAHVAEVGNVPPVTRVPGVPDWLAGVANWRGRLLPVVDLRRLLGGGNATTVRSARLVVVAREPVTLGLLVDGVDGTTSVGEEVEPFPTLLPGDGGGLVSGQLPRQDGPIAVLDVDAVIRLRDLLPRGRRSA
jgi:chemotaxis signal transduction protein